MGREPFPFLSYAQDVWDNFVSKGGYDTQKQWTELRQQAHIIFNEYRGECEGGGYNEAKFVDKISSYLSKYGEPFPKPRTGIAA